MFIKKKLCLLFALAVSVSVLFAGCGEDNKTTAENSVVETTDNPETTDAPEVTDAPENVVEGALQIDVASDREFQKIRGFGAGYTYYSNYLYWLEEYKDEVYDLLFKDANLTILRFKNGYKYDEENDYDTKVEREYYEKAKERLNEDGLEPEVLMSSWSPAAYLKTSESLYGEGTIVKDKDGNYEYEKLGEYWRELVDYYEENGVPIDYISIQNEPDYVAAYESCTLKYMETEEAACYADAFMAVYDATRECNNPPKMVGPDTMSCDSGDIALLMSDIITKKPESLSAIAHHLYVGGEEGNARSFNSNFRDIAMDYPDTEKWMSEYYRGNFMYTVQLIQNSLVYENLNAYIYWGGVWKGPVGKDMENLIGIDSGSTPEEWDHEHGYVIGEKYYSMRHFSEYILPGYIRVGTNVDLTSLGEETTPNTDEVSCSAYVSPEKDRMVIVAVNDLEEAKTYQLQLGNYNVSNSNIILTDYSKGEDTEEFYKEVGSLDENNCFEMPAHSVVTIVIDSEN